MHWNFKLKKYSFRLFKLLIQQLLINKHYIIQKLLLYFRLLACSIYFLHSIKIKFYEDLFKPQFITLVTHYNYKDNIKYWQNYILIYKWLCLFIQQRLIKYLNINSMIYFDISNNKNIDIHTWNGVVIKWDLYIYQRLYYLIIG